MGSKLGLLSGALGETVLTEASKSDRFVDLFAGSGAVSRLVAENCSIPVVSVDVQQYSRWLSACVTERVTRLDNNQQLFDWVAQTKGTGPSPVDAAYVWRARHTSQHSVNGFIERDYGGHYFSPNQARVFDQLREAIPSDPPAGAAAMAALIEAASACAAAPGHTAQPFQPTEALLPFIAKAWSKDPLMEVRKSLESITTSHARVAGQALVDDAMQVAKELDCGDLVFCDPPYSAVQYSRFYHVLEGIAVGGWDAVHGAGRAPHREFRHASAFSMKSRAVKAMSELLARLRTQGVRVLITFPDKPTSNGLSGNLIRHMAAASWRVSVRYVQAQHSTLGGGNGEEGRGARRELRECLLMLEPKSPARSRTERNGRNGKAAALVSESKPNRLLRVTA